MISFTRVFYALLFVTFFISCFLLGYSFDTLIPTRMALMYDQNIGKLDCSQTYSYETQPKGRYFTGLGVGFYDYRFPITAQHIVLHWTSGADGPIIESKSSDGVNVFAGISFQYTFIRTPENLCKIIHFYGNAENARKFIINFARSAARDAIGEFRVSDLWQQRSTIAARVKQAVGQAIEQHHVTMMNLQLLTLDIPDDIQKEVENTMIQSQMVFQLQLQQQGLIVTTRTKQLQAQQSAEISIINAIASSNATLTQAKVEALALNVTITAEAKGYAAIKNALNLTNTELLSLVYIDTLLKTTAGSVVVGENLPSILTQAGV